MAFMYMFPDHMLGDIQILQEPSQMELVDVGNKSGSNYDGTMVMKKRERVEKGNFFPKQRKFKAWWDQKCLKMMGQMF